MNSVPIGKYEWIYVLQQCRVSKRGMGFNNLVVLNNHSKMTTCTCALNGDCSFYQIYITRSIHLYNCVKYKSFYFLRTFIVNSSHPTELSLTLKRWREQLKMLNHSRNCVLQFIVQLNIYCTYFWHILF